MADESISTTPSDSGKPRCPACEGRIATKPGARCEACQELLPARADFGTHDPRPIPNIRLADPVVLEPGFLALGFIALVIILLLAFLAPGILIVLAVIAFPAAVRAIRLRAVARRSPNSGVETIYAAAFLASLGVVLSVVAAGIVAGCCVCTGMVAASGTALGSGEVILWISGGVALLVAASLFALLWPYKRHPFDPRPKAERDED